MQVYLNRPMKEILATLAKYPVKTRLSLSGPMIVARDLAHAKLRERLESGQGLPDYLKNHPVEAVDRRPLERLHQATKLERRAGRRGTQNLIHENALSRGERPQGAATLPYMDQVEGG